MAGRYGRAACGVVMATVTAAALTACGGGDDKATETMTSGPSAAAVKAPDGSPGSMVLVKEELPLGTVLVPVTDTALQQAAQSLNSPAQGQAGAKISPPECASQTVLAGNAKVDAAKLGLMSGKTGSGAVSEVVLGQRADIPAIKSKLTGKCATVTVTATQAGGASTSATINYKAVPVPKTPGEAFAATETIAVKGQNAASKKSITGWARVGDRTVIVKVTGTGADVDQAYFNQVFVSAVEKVAKAK